MNKLIIATIFASIIAGASAQAACEGSVLVALPTLEKLYMDYKNSDWPAIEADIERLLPDAENAIHVCENVTLNNARLQNCLNDTLSIWNLVQPVVANRSDTAAIYHLITLLPHYVENTYENCIKANATEMLLFSLEAKEEQLNKVGDVFQCIEGVANVLPELSTFVKDVNAKAPFATISADINTLFAQINPVCTACGIPPPKAIHGQGNAAQCLQDADGLADDADQIVQAHGNFEDIVNGIKALVNGLPQAGADCGVSQSQF